MSSVVRLCSLCAMTYMDECVNLFLSMFVRILQM